METYERNTTNQNNLGGNYFLGAKFLLQNDVSRSWLKFCFLIWWNIGGLERENRRRQWHPTPVLLPGKSHRRRSLVGCKESNTTEWLHLHFSVSCIGEGNGNPLWCSCLENPRDRGAWWAAVYGVTQSRTRLKRLSSSSSSILKLVNSQTLLQNFEIPNCMHAYVWEQLG